MELLKKLMVIHGEKLKMSNIFLCSDWHFNHSKPFIYEARGFSSIEEMNEAIIRNHNSIIKKEDVVFCLGDCCLSEKILENKNLIETLNGKIHIIRGNHCSEKRKEMYKSCKNVVEVVDGKFFNYRKYHFFLSHYLTIVGNNDAEKPLKAQVINLYGHTHTKDPFEFFDATHINYNVGMDAHDCCPVNIETILNDINERKQNVRH